MLPIGNKRSAESLSYPEPAKIAKTQDQINVKITSVFLDAKEGVVLGETKKHDPISAELSDPQTQEIKKINETSKRGIDGVAVTFDTRDNGSAKQQQVTANLATQKIKDSFENHSENISVDEAENVEVENEHSVEEDEDIDGLEFDLDDDEKLTNFNAPIEIQDDELNLDEDEPIEILDSNTSQEENFLDFEKKPMHQKQDYDLDLETDEGLDTITSPKFHESNDSRSIEKSDNFSLEQLATKLIGEEKFNKNDEGAIKSKKIRELHSLLRNNECIGIKVSSTGLRRAENYDEMNAIYNPKTNKVSVEETKVEFFLRYREDFSRIINPTHDQRRENFEVEVIDSASWRSLISELKTLRDSEKNKKEEDSSLSIQKNINLNVAIPKEKEKKDSFLLKSSSDDSARFRKDSDIQKSIESLHEAETREQNAIKKRSEEKKQVTDERSSKEENKDLRKGEIKKEDLKDRDQKKTKGGRL